MSAFDLHTHSHHSKDGLMRPRDIPRWARRRGLSGIALTDHGTPSLTRPIISDDIYIINGCEFMTTDFGELIGLFVSDPIRRSSFEETAEAIHEQSGITVLPHPRDPMRKHTAMRRSLPDALIRRHIDLIEGINSRCILPVFNSWAQNLARRLEKPMTAGSDSHSFLELGHAKTWLADISSADCIFDRLRRGETIISGHSSLFLWQLPTMAWQRARKLCL
ncbi:MAG: PHP-associated domain-containing protein [Candidatus Thorarchaeota archaeon]